MRASSFGLTLLLVAQAWSWGLNACAQPADTTSPARSERTSEKADDDSSEAIRRVEPDILFVKDAKGEMVPLLNHTLEEIEKLLELRGGGGGTSRPGFRIERLAVSGEAGPNHASLTVQLTIQASDKKWIRVPLRLGGLALVGQAEHQGEGEQFLEYDEAGREYVSWFRGESQKPHLLTLKALVPLEHVGGQTRLKLNAPRAVHSELTLQVPSPQAVGEVSLGAVLMPPRPQNNGAEFKAIGLTSDFVLSWRDKENATIESPAALDASGRIVVQVNQQSVQTRATLTVKAFGREFDSFRVRLPPGAVLSPEQHADYTVAPFGEPGAQGASSTESQWVEVRRKTRSSEQIEVQLTTRRVHEEAAAGKPIELSGFEVQGASRQWGSIAVAADHNWQVSFGKRSGVRQVEVLPENARLDDARTGDWIASFEYYRQPYSLPLYVSPRETVISVEPTYLVHVLAHRLELDARLAYRVVGAKAFSLDVDLSGWDVDVTSIGPPKYVDASTIVAKPGMPLTIPLKQAAFGELELTLRAQRDVSVDAKSVDFQLPRPAANTLGLANLIVLAADNVEITPREAAIQGLSRQPVGPKLALPPHQQEPVYYRSDSADARFAADFRIHLREVSLEASSLVHLNESGADIEQTFNYRIAYEPIETLAIDVPRELIDQSQLQFRLGDKVLSFEPIDGRDSEPQDDPAAARLVRVRVKLPEPRIGACELKIAYPWSGKPLIRQASVVLKLPLVMPAEGDCVENKLDVVVAPGIKAEPLGEEWTARPDDGASLASDATFHFSATHPRPEITFSSTLADRPTDGTLAVERAWIRTELTKTRRTDLAVYRFDSSNQRFSLILPQGCLDIVFKLDGEIIVAAPGQQSDERVVSWRDAGSEPRPHVLEVSYNVPDRGAERSRLPIDLPKLGPGITARRSYWQLVLPRDEYLVSGPGDMTSESSWDWRDFHWSRRPLLDQPFLEAWIFDASYLAERGGTAPRFSVPSAMANQYLFSSVEIGGPAPVRIAARSTLVLIGSGVVLLVGLLLIYVPALRHPAILFVASVAALTAALIYPEMTLLWLQAAVVGAGLTLLAALLERNVSRRRRREVLMRGASSSIVSRGSTRTPQRAAASAPVSTETAAIAVELSAPESRS